VFKAALLGPYMRLCGYVSVDPRNPFPAPDVARNIRHWWDLGESICLYPEGTRSADGELQPFKVGGFRLARDHGVEILPVVIDGTHGILPKGAATFRNGLFHPIRVRILASIHPDETAGDPIALCRLTHDRIAETLDEMRGRPPRRITEEPRPDPEVASA
jgi:1-acyl-sn-glycerol-3-phosphate acyltransferase